MRIPLWRVDESDLGNFFEDEVPLPLNPDLVKQLRHALTPGPELLTPIEREVLLFRFCIVFTLDRSAEPHIGCEENSGRTLTVTENSAAIASFHQKRPKTRGECSS